MPNSQPPGYVNDLPEGYPPDTPRCGYVFQHDHKYKGRGVKGRLCGLPVPDDELGGREQLCYFHSTRPRKRDTELKEKLEAAKAYVGEAQLPEAELWQAELPDARLFYSNLQGADLREANLQGTRLWHANLQGANLLDANLEGAYLSSANLEGADLRDANLQGANLWGANLQGATLYDANLQGAWLCDADLRDADLLSANLRGAHPSGADLRGASLLFVNLSYGYLAKAEMQGTCLKGANLVNANLWGVNVALLDRIDEETGLVTTTPATLERADLRGASLLDARIAPEVNLSELSFAFPITRRWFPWQKRGWIGLRGIRRWWRLRRMRWGEYHIRDERCASSDEEWHKIRTLYGWDEYMRRPTLADCHTLYRQLKLNYQESGDYQTAGEFFVREMECKRAQMVKDRKPLLQRFWPALMYFLCGYGERPKWIAAWALVLVALFAFVHGWWGLRDSAGDYVMGPGIDWIPSLAGMGRWLTAAYFSVVTFTSLGYGDLAPGAGWGRFFAGLEAALGIVIMSLFLICVVRKYSR